MTYWTMTATGREHLKLAHGDVPVPGPREVLVKVGAAALNFRDRLAIDDGLTMVFPETGPFVPGSDMAGTVVAVGAAVERWQPGDRVISVSLPGWIDGSGPGDALLGGPEALGSGYFPGVFSEYVVLDQEWVVSAPANLTDAEASALPMAGLTAWTALVERGRLRAGQTVLVQGTGGVSLFGLQIAAAHGAKVIVTSGDDAKLARAAALGADHGINRNSRDWVQAVHELTAGHGADHILEIVGGAHLARSLEAAAVGGHVSLIGVLGGFEFAGKISDLARKKLTLHGIQVGHRRSLEELVRAVDQAGISPVIDTAYPHTELPEALDHMTRGPFGKVVLTFP
ncbi:NAD(P)-dependent alcohol dehydrogenase [Actinomadura rudentiformis]|uniref:NAD(P)-dependent alcohol dehydrogenase n=2 Tax=Actinomadura rudentiformis TaxID=359158 RepID=A0A6H9YFY2_9ACTN|nr:NAD(P)-dependent alcohol dehydrogenase [Actinomadura rudentiformis]